MKITLPIKELNEVFQILGSVVPSRAVRMPMPEQEGEE